jgi:tetratricopeptide (TPR) repeat protein
MAKAYHNRGLAYYNNEDIGSALEDFKAAIELEPQFANAYAMRGLIYKDLGATKKAISDLELALTIGLEPEMKSVVETALEEIRE